MPATVPKRRKINHFEVIRSKPAAEQPIYINISGLQFETRQATLNRWPETLLGNEVKRAEFFCNISQEYFFDRHRESFSSILFFYQSSGKLCRPQDVNFKVFLDECQFFQLPRWAVTDMKRKECGIIQDEVLKELETKKQRTIPNLRKRIWEFLERPSSSKSAMFFAYWYLFLLLCSVFLNCAKSVHQSHHIKARHHAAWETVDIVINVYFLAEFILRLVIAPDKRAFFQRTLVWIDFIALATFIPTIHAQARDDPVAMFFAPFQTFRVLRVFYVARMLPGVNKTAILFKSSMEDFQMFVMCLLIFVIFAGTLIYETEKKEDGTDFTSIPNSMYWATQTVITLGYGDIVPTTPVGKLFACAFILCCIPALSIPVLSILVKFSKFIDFMKTVNEGTEQTGSPNSFT